MLLLGVIVHEENEDRHKSVHMKIVKNFIELCILLSAEISDLLKATQRQLHKVINIASNSQHLIHVYIFDQRFHYLKQSDLDCVLQSSVHLIMLTFG